MSTPLRAVVSAATYPVVLFGSLGLTALGLAAGGRPSLVVVAVVALVTPVVLLAQRLAPAEPGWRGRPLDFSVDVLHLLSNGVFTEIFRLLTLGAVYEVAASLSAAGSPAWPGGAPWLVQFGLALLVGEFFAYWTHRTFHRVPFLWRIHAVHHSSERMYALAAARNHPMNVVLMHACHVLPVAALGAPPEILAMSGALTGIHGLLQHSNVDLWHGPFNWIMATADAHRWHHSADLAESDTNFGNNLIVWDRVFGTCRLPGGRPKRVGLDAGRLPDNFLAHLATPFRLYRLLRARDDV